MSFNLIRFVVCEKMDKTDFQDGGSGGHLGFLITMFLAHSDPECFLLLQSKYGSNWQKVWEEMLKIDFSRWCFGGHLGFLINSVLFFFVPTTCRQSDAPHQVSIQLDHSLQRSWRKYELSKLFSYKCIGPIQIYDEKNLTLPEKNQMTSHRIIILAKLVDLPTPIICAMIRR